MFILDWCSENYVLFHVLRFCLQSHRHKCLSKTSQSSSIKKDKEYWSGHYLSVSISSRMPFTSTWCVLALKYFPYLKKVHYTCWVDHEKSRHLVQLTRRLHCLLMPLCAVASTRPHLIRLYNNFSASHLLSMKVLHLRKYPDISVFLPPVFEMSSACKGCDYIHCKMLHTLLPQGFVDINHFYFFSSYTQSNSFVQSSFSPCFKFPLFSSKSRKQMLKSWIYLEPVVWRFLSQEICQCTTCGLYLALSAHTQDFSNRNSINVKSIVSD